jgi:hypothetical protein
VATEYKLHELAFEEYIAAFQWYETEQEGLGEKFIEAIDNSVNQICKNPEFFGYVKAAYRQAIV